MIRILIADDHPIVRKGLIGIFEDITDMYVADEAADGVEVLRLLNKKEYDVLILDLKMPNLSGFETLEKIKQKYPTLKVLVLSALPEEQFAVRILDAGADGYMHKEEAAENLLRAVRRIIEGHKYISPNLSEQLVEVIHKTKRSKTHEILSDREFQILRMIGEGKSVSEISSLLNLSSNTISTYRRRILDKMNFNSNADLVKYCISEGIIDIYSK